MHGRSDECQWQPNDLVRVSGRRVAVVNHLLLEGRVDETGAKLQAVPIVVVMPREE